MRKTTILRRRYLERMANGEVILCGLCGEPVPAKAKGKNRISAGGKGGLSIDHIIEQKNGGTDALENLQPAHVRCNFEKSNSVHRPTRALRVMEEMEMISDAATDRMMRNIPIKRPPLMRLWEMLYGRKG